jgi:SAM-dependent methyltransferase
VLEVDGHVISKDELVDRVEQLVQAAREQPSEVTYSVSSGLAPGDLEEQVHALRFLQGHVTPPGLARASGLRGQLAWGAKRAIRKATSWYVEPRWRTQQDFDVRTAEFATQVLNQLRLLTREVEGLRRNQLTLRMQLVSTVERANALQGRMRSAAEEMAQRHRDVSELLLHRPDNNDLRQEVDVLHREVTSLLERLGAGSSSGAEVDYVGFENRFRGSSEELKNAQRHYLDWLPGDGVPGRVLDVGCGRGEMLEVLNDAGYDSFGVDSDAGMVEECRKKELDVVDEGAVPLLERLEENSLKAIFCSQVVEHLLTSELQRFVSLSYDDLREGGVLIVETINPRSSFALGEHFYADPSHIRPVHPETLRFICEQIGFNDVQLQEQAPHPSMGMIEESASEEGPGNAVNALLKSVFGYQDYAIIATK